MPKPAQPQAQEKTFNCEITVPIKYLKQLDEAVESDSPIAAKVAFAAEGALLDICEGGLMLNAKAVQRMAESLGHSPNVDETVDNFCKGAGRVAGKLQITVGVPPETEGMFEQIREFQGKESVQAVVQDLFDTALDNGDFYDYRPYAERVLMGKQHYDKLVAKLGKPFSTGTELAELVEKYLAEKESPFAEVEK